MKTFPRTTLFLITIILVSCASQQQLSERDALSKFHSVASLKQSFERADHQSLALLSQTSYRKAKDALAEAKSNAMKNNPKADAVAISGQKYLDRAISNADSASDIFSEVLEARNGAVKRGALEESAKAMGEADKDFKELTLALETGDADKAKIRRPEMIQRYYRLELASIKKATVDDAKSTLFRAKANKAHKYAPKTYASAEKELDLAASILDSDMNSRDRAAQAAEKSVWLAERSMSISDTVKEFRSNDFELEDIVLWYQSQLSRATQPLNTEIPLNMPNNNLINSVSSSIENLVAERNEIETALMDSERRYSDAMTSSQTELAAMERRQKNVDEERIHQTLAEKKIQEKLAGVQGIFNEDEATVYLQRNNILIRAHGFWFPSGKSEIESQNFSILNKIAKAISFFPGASIVISGHTDSVGSEETNMVLSIDRAVKVSRFLNEVGNVASDRLASEGFGKTKPVESNGTPEGRAANRRVEVLIVN